MENESRNQNEPVKLVKQCENPQKKREKKCRVMSQTIDVHQIHCRRKGTCLIAPDEVQWRSNQTQLFGCPNQYWG